jgi:hypothetical protein
MTMDDQPKYTKRLDPGAEHANRLAAKKLLERMAEDGHRTPRPVDWARLARDAGLGDSGGDSNRDADTVSDDPDPHITEQGTCSNCGYQLEFDDLRALNFVAEESGVNAGTVHGPAVHWASGTIKCDGCDARLPYEVSSD